eukprot:3648190-Rhodomonas_salina.1
MDFCPRQHRSTSGTDGDAILDLVSLKPHPLFHAVATQTPLDPVKLPQKGSEALILVCLPVLQH